MRIGVPKEIKNHEYRVGMVPAGVHALAQRGHQVLVETGAGAGSGIDDTEYRAAGAEIAPSAVAVYGTADMIVKVKEPLPAEYPLLRKDQVLFTYLHLAPAPELTEALLKAGVVGIAYETVQTADGRLPLLTPMSEVAGRLAVQVGAACLQRNNSGRGVLLPGVPGVAPGKVAIVGGGVVGSNAALVARGLGADVTLLDVNVDRLRQLSDQFGSGVKTVVSNAYTVQAAAAEADLVIGAVLVPGARAPRVVIRDTIRLMRPGAVIVDVAIDQGGCVETARPTTHADPTYAVDGVIHYCVTNMPGAVARTSTFALSNVTLPYVLTLADRGWEQAAAQDASLRGGLNVVHGEVTHAAVAESLGYSQLQGGAA